MVNPELNINKAFKEQVESNMTNSFSGKTIMTARKGFKKGNTCIISIIMFYDDINNMIFKVSSSIVYCIMENYACVDYIFCMKTKLHVTSKGQRF